MKEKEPSKESGLKDFNLDYAEFLVKFGNEKLREFFLQGAINEQALAFTLHSLNYISSLGNDPIKMTMHTYGGGINEGMAIYDHIKSLGKKTPIDITATGACMSMGMIILQSARKRYATPNVCFMLHQLRGSNEGNLGQQRDQYQHMEKLQAKMNIILAQRTKKTVKQIDKLIDRKDYFIGAEEALNMNLIDAIV